MHLVIDVPGKNFVNKNFDEKSDQTFKENNRRMNQLYSGFDQQVQKISSFFNSKISNFERLFLADLGKSANEPNAPNTELQGNASLIQCQRLTDKNLIISSNCIEQHPKEAEYTNLSYKMQNNYYSLCQGNSENLQNKFNLNIQNDNAQSQSQINNATKNKFDLKSDLHNFKEKIQFDNLNNHNQSNEKNENYKYRTSDDNNHNDKFFYETAKENFIENNTNTNRNLFTSDKMLNKAFNNLDTNENCFYNQTYLNNGNNNNKSILNFDLQTIPDPKANSIQDILKYLNLNLKNDSNNGADFYRHFFYESLKNMMNSFNPNNKRINFKPDDIENIKFPFCFSLSNFNDFNNSIYANANHLHHNQQSKMFTSNNCISTDDFKKDEFWALSQMQLLKSRGSSENKNCSSKAPLSKLSEDLKLLGKKTKKPSKEIKASLENKKQRMLKIKNETKIFNSLLKAISEETKTKRKTGMATTEADSAKQNSLDSLEKRKALKNNKLVYVVKNNRMFQNPSNCPVKNSMTQSKHAVSNENESDSKASFSDCNLNEEDKGFLSLQSNKEASTIDLVENNSQAEKKEDLSNEFMKAKSKRSSNFRGVSKNGNQWQVLIMINKKKMYIGSFSSEEEAAKNYDYVALKNHGSKAKTNFFYTEEQILSLLNEYFGY